MKLKGLLLCVVKELKENYFWVEDIRTKQIRTFSFYKFLIRIQSNSLFLSLRMDACFEEIVNGKIIHYNIWWMHKFSDYV